MFDEKTKLFLIKAMTEGLHCKFKDVSEIENYIDKLRSLVDKSEKIKSTLIGDADGLLMEDESGDAYGMIKFTKNLITFGLLVPEPDLDNTQSADFGRIVLACISTFAALDTQSKKQKVSKKMVNATHKFEISDIGIIT